ncbi:MAG: hypothetical protein JXR96_16905 [Deltaproteobacteria bacterium]|nr:hypothetical protein [Deltaproteobacteria bacterium]
MTGDEARIVDQGYQPFEGKLGSVRTRFAAIAFNEIRQAWKGKWFRRVAVLAFFPLGVFGMLAVLQARMPGLVAFGGIWPEFASTQIFFAMLMVYYLGRNAVAEDLRTGALTTYFSRPVSFVQYLGGKWLAVAIGVLGVTALPGLLLAGFRWAVEPDTDFLRFTAWAGGLLLFALMLSAVQGAVVLGISACTRRGRTAGIVWVLVFFLSSALSEGLVAATGLGAFRAIGFGQGATYLAEVLLDERGFGHDGAWYALGLAVWTIGAAGIVFFRLRRWRRL